MSSPKEKTSTILDEPLLITGGQTFHSVTDKISSITERKTPPAWFIAIGISGSAVLMLFGMIGYLFWEGIGIWGNQVPVGWGWPIVNFVFWVGIGHAGTLISAILFLLRQRWRTSINRFAEAMTIFAVMCALLFPSIHVGRVYGMS
ncbi:polysulfide reductase NrfD [candidate division KSB1 bacterium]|nr:polysulfide reductase NrfD [candidate division KSB1 bacterium]